MSVVRKNDVNIIYYDLESTGFGNSAEIIQIAARSNTHEFNVYINPEKFFIPTGASEVTGIKKVDGELRRHGKRLQTKSITDGLRSFERFIIATSRPKKCLLVAHNNATFDARILLHQVNKCGLVKNFCDIIYGFADTYPLFRQLMPERKGPNKFKLETLVNDFLQLKQRQDYHDATCDVELLERLVNQLSSEDKLLEYVKTFHESYNKILESNKISSNLQSVNQLTMIVPENIKKKLALHGISCKSMIKTYKNQGEEGIISLFTEKVDGKPRITKDKKILDKVLKYVKNPKETEDEVFKSFMQRVEKNIFKKHLET